MKDCDTCYFCDRPPYKSPCSECDSGSKWEKNAPNRQTNADKYFRNATDEEIADFLAQRLRCEEYDCPAYDFCTDYSAEGAMTKTQFCIRVLSDWLKQEVSE